MSRLQYLIVSTWLVRLVLSLTFSSVAPTIVPDLSKVSISQPLPTRGPPHVDFPRSIIKATDNTCGWDSTGIALTCPEPSSCVFYKTKGHVGMAGCCSASKWDECGWSNTCYDYQEIMVSNKCDADCFRNSFVKKCTEASSKYCQTWTYFARDIKDYGCGTDGASTVTVMTWSSVGSKGGTLSVTPIVLAKNEVSGWLSASSATRSSTGSQHSQTSKQKSDDNGSNAGAIAGGVVGGVVALAAITAAVVFLLWRQRAKKTSGVQPQYVEVSRGDPHWDGPDKFATHRVYPTTDTAYQPQHQFSAQQQQQPHFFQQPPIPAIPQSQVAQLHMTPVQEAPSPENNFPSRSYPPSELDTPQSTYHPPIDRNGTSRPGIFEMGTTNK